MLRPARLIWVSERLRRDAHRGAVFVLELDHARSAVAGEVQHVELVVRECTADLHWVADLEEAHLDVVVARGWRDRVQNSLQLALEVEHRVGRPAFVGRADSHDYLERRRRGTTGQGLGAGDDAPHGDAGRERGDSTIEARSFEGQREERRFARFEAQLERLAGVDGLQARSKLPADAVREKHATQRLAELDDGSIEGLLPRFGRPRVANFVCPCRNSA